MEVIGKNKASQYRKECETKKHQIKKVIRGKQRWVAGPDLTAAELATRMEDIKQYDATNDTNPRCATISKNWFANQLTGVQETQDAQAKVQERQGEVQKALAEEQERQAKLRADDLAKAAKLRDDDLAKAAKQRDDDLAKIDKNFHGCKTALEQLVVAVGPKSSSKRRKGKEPTLEPTAPKKQRKGKEQTAEETAAKAETKKTADDKKAENKKKADERAVAKAAARKKTIDDNKAATLNKKKAKIEEQLAQLTAHAV